VATVLFLVADTGGGHRRAAQAVTPLLPPWLTPDFVEPLGAGSLVQRVTSLYGPMIRWAPRLWGWIYRVTDNPAAVWVLQRTFLRAATRAVSKEVAQYRPSAVVSFHPLTTAAAVRAGIRIPLITVVTDLATAHQAWRTPGADAVTVPSAAVQRRFHLDGWPPARCVATGLPVADRQARTGRDRVALRRSLGFQDEDFVVLVVGGAEGAGGMDDRVAAIVNRLPNVHVVAICGRNRRLVKKLSRLGGERLTVKGFVDNPTDWVRSADVVVGKAGPATIAEAACCGAALLLTSYVPGQEQGNADLVVQAGAGLFTPSIGHLLENIQRLRANRADLDAMRAAAVRSARPDAARQVADQVTALAGCQVGWRRAGGSA
jgi:1,2-diacylglycerol 3-beta-galactosyltransferase